MKKLLQMKFMLLLCALIVGSGTMWADDVTFSYSDYKGEGTQSTGSEYTMVKTDVSIKNTKFYGNNSYAHFYANGTTTITPGTGVTITKIELTASATGYNGYQSNGTITASTGTVSGNTSSTTVTWTGSATEAFTISNDKQIRWTSIEVTYTTSAAPAYTITAQSNYTDYGTVSLSGNVITGSPKTGYRYADPAYTVSPPNSATVSQNGNQFTVTPSANTTVTINFEAIPTHTATFSINGTTSSQDFAEGADITFPQNIDAIDDYVFVGWITTPAYPVINVPELITSATMGNADVTYYAVFAKVSFDGEPVETLGQTLQYDTWTYSGATTDKSSYRLFGNGSYVESAAFDLSKLSMVKIFGGTFGGQGTYKTVTIGDGTNVWKEVEMTGTGNAKEHSFTDGTPLTGNKPLRIISTCGDGSNSGIRMSKIEIYVLEPTISYSDYTTTVVADPREESEITFLNANNVAVTEIKVPTAFSSVARFLVKPTMNMDGVEIEDDNYYNDPSTQALCTIENAEPNDQTIDPSTVYDVMYHNGAEDKYKGYIEIFAYVPGTFDVYIDFAGNNDYKPVKSVLHVTAYDALSVAEASAAIEAGTGTNGVCVKGVVTGLLNTQSNNGSLTYFISDDGTSEGNLLEVLEGKSFHGANFTSTSDIQAGDYVCIYGNLTTKDNLPTLASGNELLILDRTPRIAVASENRTVTANAAAQTTSIKVYYRNFDPSTVLSEDDVQVLFCAEDGIHTVDNVDWVTIDNPEFNYGYGYFTLNCSFAKNEGDTRTAYARVMINSVHIEELDYNCGTDVITITQNPKEESEITFLNANNVAVTEIKVPTAFSSVARFLVKPTMNMDGVEIEDDNYYNDPSTQALCAIENPKPNDQTIDPSTVFGVLCHNGAEDKYKGYIDIIAYVPGTFDVSINFAGNDAYGSKKAVLHVTAYDAISVAEARAAIDAGPGNTDFCVKGVVCTAPSSINSDGQLTYFITDDGITTSDQLEVYKGFSFNGAQFTSKDDIKVGDYVCVFGNLTKFTGASISIYEFSSPNELVLLDRTPRIAVASENRVITANATAHTTNNSIKIYNRHFTHELSEDYVQVQFYAEDGKTAVNNVDWVTINNPEFNDGYFTMSCTFTENTGDARTAYARVKIKIQHEDLDSDCLTDLITITQEAPQPLIIVNETDTNITLTAESGNRNIGFKNYNFTTQIPDNNFFDFVYCDADGNIVNKSDAGYDWITYTLNSWNNGEDCGMYIQYAENTTSSQRTAYLKIHAVDNNTDVYSNLITITQAAPSHTATFFVNGTQNSSVEVETGTAISFPQVSDTDGMTFLGWTTTPIDGTTDEAPKIVTSALMGNGDVTYYAVFAVAGDLTEGLVKMVAGNNFNNGDKIVIVANVNEETAYGLYQKLESGNYVSNYVFNGSYNTVILDDKNWLTVSSGSTEGTWYMGDDTDGYLYTSGSNNLTVSTDYQSEWTLQDNENGTFSLITNGRWLSCRSDLTSSNANLFRLGGTTSGNPSGTIIFDIYKIAQTRTLSDYCTTIPLTVTIAEACTDGKGKYYGTFSSSSAFVVPENLTVSEIGIDDDGKMDVRNYESGAVVPANTGVMVSATTPGNFKLIKSSAEGKSVLGAENRLRPTGDGGITAEGMVAEPVVCKYYRLTMHDGTKLGFWYGAAEGAAFAVVANKAYLAVPATAAGAREGFAFDDDSTTGISNVNVNENVNGSVFDLQGRKVSTPGKGLYIVNGKKVVIK